MSELDYCKVHDLYDCPYAHEPVEPEFQTLDEMVDYIEAKKTDLDNTVMSMEFDDNEIASLEKRLKAAKAAKNTKSDKRWKLARDIKQANEKMEALKRRLAAEAEAARLAKQMELRKLTLDDLLKDAKWRDRAMPHQLDAMYMASAAQRMVIGDAMGLGKTFEIGVMARKALEVMGDSNGKWLIIAPGEVISGFEEEFNNWETESPINNLANLGTKGTIETIDLMEDLIPDRIDLINYEILARSADVVQRLVMVQYDGVILDEIHRAKETSKNTYKACEQIVLSHNTCPLCGKFAMPTHASGQSHGVTAAYRTLHCTTKGHGMVQGERSVKNVFPMTGTLILNRPDEAFAAFHLVNDTVFPRLSDFLYDYCEKGSNGKYRWQFGGESRFVKKIQGMYIRRTREDAGIKLPPQNIKVHELELDKDAYPLQLKFLQNLARAAQVEIDEGKAVTFASILALITRQRQGSVWPGGVWMDISDRWGNVTREHVGLKYLESIKLDKAVELYNEFTEAGERVLIISQFKEPLIEMKARLGEDVVEFHGDTPRWLRDEVKSNFNRVLGETPKWKGVLAHYKLANEGLNLTGITQTIVLDEQWNPGMNEQAYQRTQRMGQTMETGVHILRIKDSIDYWLSNLIEEKRKIRDGFDTEFSFQQLAELFTKEF